MGSSPEVGPVEEIQSVGSNRRGDRQPWVDLAERPKSSASSAFPSLDEAMRQHIEAALARTRGRMERARGAAKLLKINPHTLRARMRKLGIRWDRYRLEE